MSQPDYYDANQFFIYHGEVPDAVGKWVAVVRAGTSKKESWIFCTERQIPRIREKYRDDFLRIAGKVLVDRKPIRIPRVESYVIQLSEEEEALVAMNSEYAKPLNSGEWNDAKSAAPEYNPLLDAPRLIKGVSSLSAREREFFNLWRDRQSQYAIQTSLNISRGSLLSFRSVIRKKLSDYVGSKDPKDFERRIQAIPPVIRRLIDERVEQTTQKVKTVLTCNLENDFPNISDGLKILTPGERRFFDLWTKGDQSISLGEALGITPSTVDSYQREIKKKLGTRTQALSLREFEQSIIAAMPALQKYLESNQQLNMGDKIEEFNPVIDIPTFALRLADLSSRQREYFDLWAEGRTSSETESAMAISHRTAREYRKLIRNKLGDFIEAANNSDFERRIRFASPKLREYLAGSFVPDATIPEPVEEPVVTPVTVVITFNEFLQAYGSRKDAIKALEQFNRIPIEQRPSIMADIPKYKASLVHANYQMSPYQYLIGRSWTK